MENLVFTKSLTVGNFFAYWEVCLLIMSAVSHGFPSESQDNLIPFSTPSPSNIWRPWAHSHHNFLFSTFSVPGSLVVFPRVGFETPFQPVCLICKPSLLSTPCSGVSPWTEHTVLRSRGAQQVHGFLSRSNPALLSMCSTGAFPAGPLH